MGVNPLRGANDKRFGVRFPDMTEVYDKDFQEIVCEEAKSIAEERLKNGLDAQFSPFLRRGVYCALSGPTYETPAEIHMFECSAPTRRNVHRAGAIAARHQKMRVLGISCITNMAAGISGDIIHHEEVMETGAQVAGIFKELLRRVILKIN
jgi:purine-nucleoside phosphorylase